jgi:ACR3 family arsenite efflux pump ArsB
MTLPMSRNWIRWTLGAGLVGAWLYVFVAWRNYPQGAATTIQCLIGFIALGLAPWIAPSVQWSRLLRAAGALMAFVAFALALVLYTMLRDGL